MLAEAAAGTDTGPAERTGRAWGERLLLETGAVGGGDGPVEVAAHLQGVLDSIGFAPEMAIDGPEIEVTLGHCPFLEVARRHPALVCGMHEALIQGVLDGLDSGMRVQRLVPFVTPGRCIARLGPSEPSLSAPPPGPELSHGQSPTA